VSEKNINLLSEKTQNPSELYSIYWRLKIHDAKKAAEDLYKLPNRTPLFLRKQNPIGLATYHAEIILLSYEIITADVEPIEAKKLRENDQNKIDEGLEMRFKREAERIKLSNNDLTEMKSEKSRKQGKKPLQLALWRSMIHNDFPRYSIPEPEVLIHQLNSNGICSRLTEKNLIIDRLSLNVFFQNSINKLERLQDHFDNF
jgi:hypothetical protein